MCGCMLMHAVMEQHEHLPVGRTASVTGANEIAVSIGQHCPQCGFLLQQAFAFCPGCGMSLRNGKCPACGQKVDPDLSSCTYCGSPLGELRGQQAPH
jgi:hypothetical protein